MAGQILVITVTCGALLIGCDKSSPSLQDQLSGPCATGALGCPSDASGKCSGTLKAIRGFCTLTGCTEGTEGCGCHPDGTCDAKADGAPMACNGNVCVGASSAAAGTLGGSCLAGGTCTSTAKQPLVCVQGECEQADCPSGRLGCPSGPFGACQAVEGNPARSERGICTLGGCPPGAVGCRCGADVSCGVGLTCDNGSCRRAALGVEVASPSVRSCLVEVASAQQIGNVLFDKGLRGKVIHRGATAMISFTAISDSSMANPAVRLEPAGASGAAPRIASATCFDAAGAVLLDAAISLK